MTDTQSINAAIRAVCEVHSNGQCRLPACPPRCLWRVEMPGILNIFAEAATRRVAASNQKLVSLLKCCAGVRVEGGMRLDEGSGDLPTELRQMLAEMT